MRRAARARPASDLVIGTRAVAVAVAAPLLARLDLPRLQRVLEPRRVADPGVDARATATRVVAVVDRVNARAGRAVRPGCLVRGISRYAALRRAGVDVALCFGMGRPRDELEGHCWLTLGTDVVFEHDGDRPHFTEVVRMSRAGVEH
jgi:hypothetical protein